MKRSAVREATGRYRATNPRVFGFVLHDLDHDGSDIDILVDASSGATLFDIHPYHQNGYNGLAGVKLANKRTQSAVVMSLIVIVA